MAPRTKFAVEKIDQLVETLVAAPELPPKFVSREAALQKLAGPIRDMHDKKNYEPRQIVDLLKQNGVKITLKDVRDIVSGTKQTSSKKAPKSPALAA